LQQINDETNSWAEFYMANRIEVQVKMAVDKGVWGAEMVRKSNRLYVELENIIPRENPALLHGDLWSGNIMATENDAPVIYDPAVYFGHREMDLAMTKLFGGFTPNFYEAYTAEYSLEPCFETRAQIHQLYPILVHVNLFGGGYKAQAESIISQYI
jgi:fructosamine-3-kinase